MRPAVELFSPKKSPATRAGLAVEMAGSLDCFLHFLGGPEGKLLRGLDLDLLAGRRIAAHAGGALAHLEDAETGDANFAALLEVLHGEVDEGAEQLVDALLRHLIFFGQLARHL